MINNCSFFSMVVVVGISSTRFENLLVGNTFSYSLVCSIEIIGILPYGLWTCARAYVWVSSKMCTFFSPRYADEFSICFYFTRSPVDAIKISFFPFCLFAAYSKFNIYPNNKMFFFRICSTTHTYTSKIAEITSLFCCCFFFRCIFFLAFFE